jgi:hypothetical protein
MTAMSPAPRCIAINQGALDTQVIGAPKMSISLLTFDKRHGWRHRWEMDKL